ncbi:MAG: HDOD domain-containing protein, partial [Gemmataceae bacterium]|nr:HDOD domain-containing protein [Gemmataceae bacterium]
RECSAPIVLAAHGAAIAGGCALLGGADVVITHHEAKIGYPVVRLGIWKCRSLVVAVGVRSVLRGRSKEGDRERAALWHHGHLTASLCSLLNKAARLGFKGEEYSAGLLHDLGRVLVALADPECLKLAGMMDFADDRDPRDRERAAIGADHCALGGWFAGLSNLPAELAEVIGQHHTPTPQARLVSLVAAADHMANHLQVAKGATGYDPATSPGLACLCDGWADGRREHLFASLPHLMQSAVSSADDDATP